jgi:hypothetical protein
VTDRIDKELKRPGWLAAAWIVKVIPRARWTPVGENTDETARLDRGVDLVFGQIRKPEASERRVLYLRNSVKGGPTLYANFQFAASFPKFPRV